MGRPPTTPTKLKDGYYLEIRNIGSKSGIKIRRDTEQEMINAKEQYEKSKTVIVLGEYRDGKPYDKNAPKAARGRQRVVIPKPTTKPLIEPVKSKKKEAEKKATAKKATPNKKAEAKKTAPKKKATAKKTAPKKKAAAKKAAPKKKAAAKKAAPKKKTTTKKGNKK